MGSIRQRQSAGRPRKSGDRFPSGDIKPANRLDKEDVRSAMIDRVIKASESEMFPQEYCGRHLAGINCVYFINQVNTRLYKIGYTRDLKARMKQLSTGASMQLNPVAWVCVRDASMLMRVEAMAHKQAHLLGEHMRGEWFKIEPCYIYAIVEGLRGLGDQFLGYAIDEFHGVGSVIAKSDQLFAEDRVSAAI